MTDPMGRGRGSLTTILFVDDEQNVLQGIRRSMRSMRDRWHIEVADGGEAALELLERLERIDVVVCDMRMSGMDGAELLHRVRQLYPSTARLVLSGQADRDSVFRAIGPAHQFLAKPCDTEQLIEVIDRVRAWSDSALGEPVRRLLCETDHLPSPPEVYVRMHEVMARDEWVLADLAAVLEDDPAMTAVILKLVNSAFFGFNHRVETVVQAVSLLGVETVRGLVLGEQAFQQHQSLAPWLDLEALAHRSRNVAHVARALVLRQGGSPLLAARAFLAGMVNEIGLLVVARLDDVPALVAEAVNDLQDPEIDSAVFGGSRFRVGARLLELWGFTPELVTAIRSLEAPPSFETNELAWYLAAARHVVGSDDLAVEDVLDLDREVGGLSELLAELGERIAVDPRPSLRPKSPT